MNISVYGEKKKKNSAPPTPSCSENKRAHKRGKHLFSVHVQSSSSIWRECINRTAGAGNTQEERRAANTLLRFNPSSEMTCDAAEVQDL